MLICSPLLDGPSLFYFRHNLQIYFNFYSNYNIEKSKPFLFRIIKWWQSAKSRKYYLLFIKVLAIFENPSKCKSATNQILHVKILYGHVTKEPIPGTLGGQ